MARVGAVSERSTTPDSAVMPPMPTPTPISAVSSGSPAASSEPERDRQHGVADHHAHALGAGVRGLLDHAAAELHLEAGGARRLRGVRERVARLLVELLGGHGVDHVGEPDAPVGGQGLRLIGSETAVTSAAPAARSSVARDGRPVLGIGQRLAFGRGEHDARGGAAGAREALLQQVLGLLGLRARHGELVRRLALERRRRHGDAGQQHVATARAPGGGASAPIRPAGTGTSPSGIHPRFGEQVAGSVPRGAAPRHRGGAPMSAPRSAEGPGPGSGRLPDVAGRA